MEQIKIGVSACLIGDKCNFAGNDIFSEFVTELSSLPQIDFVKFCPEHFIFGTPRPNLRVVGGDGADVLNGIAKVINDEEEDVTEQQIKAAEKFLSIMIDQNIKYAFLTDGSPSCGVSVLLNEDQWPKGGFRKGVGVSTALLNENGIQTFSSFDERDINRFLVTLVSDYKIDLKLKNLSENPKFQKLFSF